MHSTLTKSAHETLVYLYKIITENKLQFAHSVPAKSLYDYGTHGEPTKSFLNTLLAQCTHKVHKEHVHKICSFLCIVRKHKILPFLCIVQLQKSSQQYRKCLFLYAKCTIAPFFFFRSPFFVSYFVRSFVFRFFVSSFLTFL